MFHLGALAYFQFQNEFFGGSKVVEIEKEVKVPLRIVNASGKEIEFTEITRFVDLVLAGSGSSEIWKELKSYQWISETCMKKNFSRWMLRTIGRTSNHRQFFLDRVANKQDLNEGFNWLFHKFRQPNLSYSVIRLGLAKNKKASVRRLLTNLPNAFESNQQNIIPPSLGWPRKKWSKGEMSKQNDLFRIELDLKKTIKMLNFKSMFDYFINKGLFP